MEIVQRSGHKVLMFSSFVKHFNLFRTELEHRQAPYAFLSGDMDQRQRKEAVQRFQEDPAVQTFLISIKSGAPLNLTAADYVFIPTLWNPTTEQAIARAHRIGQQRNVFAHKFITRDSIEEKILRLQDRKKQLADDIIGTSGNLTLDANDIDYLLKLNHDGSPFRKLRVRLSVPPRLGRVHCYPCCILAPLVGLGALPRARGWFYKKEQPSVK
ncbi:MAG: C-terminal helicase domain-containing protein [Saprospiraceae bacterium]